MATDTTEKVDVRNEQRTPNNKTIPGAAERSSVKNKTEKKTNLKKDNKPTDEKKDRPKVCEKQYNKLANTTSEEFVAKNPYLGCCHRHDASVPYEYMAEERDDDLKYLEHYYYEQD